VQNKKESIVRVYLVYIAMLLFAVLIVVQIARVQFVEGVELKHEAETMTLSMRTIEAPRGNIYADNERKTSLALSVPRYKIYMDLVTVSDEDFEAGVGGLSDSLAMLFDTKTTSQWEMELRDKKYKDSSQYHIIKAQVRNEQLIRMREFPIFRLGKYKGGYIEVSETKRVKPYGLLASRTVGFVRYLDSNETYSGKRDTILVGLEGYFNEYLKGEDGEMLMQKIEGSLWKPVQNDISHEPIPGGDVYTSIDIDLQDVAERALMKQLKNQNALNGCAVLMEVETGFIKAIANITQDTKTGKFHEWTNLAVGAKSEPGSTFKLASLMVALDDGKVRVTDSVDMTGRYTYYGLTLRDPTIYGKNTIQFAFEKSSNVISQIINDAYKSEPQKYIDGLKDIGLDKKLGVDIKGEAQPYIKDASDTTFWGTSLPWMSIGYEVLLTPLQTLSLYNAVANDGKMVKPQFVKEIRDGDKIIKKFEPIVLNPQICKPSTNKILQTLMEGVVERGTARNIRARGFKIAGKTGTAKIAQDGGYGDKYQASFCGYFPADNPKYSCIVVIQGPTKQIYGAVVSGTVFKEIADKVYAGSLEESVQPELALEDLSLPYSKDGNKKDIKTVMNEMGVQVQDGSTDSDWVITKAGLTSVKLQNRKVKKGEMPNVTGMGLLDAVYILESQGLTVKIKGSGIVKKQSVIAGAEIYKRQLVTIELI
jgi:cell division protein FtsI (penicillin-binding protein 3)